MRMKKMLAAFMTAGLCMFSLAGCNTTTNNYVKELAKTATWGAAETEYNGSIVIEENGQKETLLLTGTAFNNGNKGMSQIKITDKSGRYNIPEIKCYVDNGTTYINKSYFVDIYKLNGETIPAGLANLKAEYIQLDTEIDISKIQQISKDPQAIINLGKILFGEADVDLPLKQNGREYSLNMNSDEMIDYGFKLVKAAANNLDNLNTTFALGLTAENITEIKSGVNNSDDQINALKSLFVGSTCNAKQTFTDNSGNKEFNMNLKIKDVGSININLTAKSQKADKKEIVMPSNAVKLTEEELHKLLYS